MLAAAIDLAGLFHRLGELKWTSWILIALAIAVVILVVWLLVRWRKKPKTAAKPEAAPVDWRARARDWLTARLDDLRYLSTRREWRYRSPWVLLMGETGAGKSSLCASLDDRRREALLLRERRLPIAGSDWGFFSGGVLIDPEGRLPAAAPTTADGKQWQGMLSAIVRRRPERPIDNLLLAVAADTLLGSDEAALRALAENCYRQLWQAQKELRFVIPTYVVITRCDLVPGYSAYWQALPEERRRELWGWSNPSLDDHESAARIADTVMSTVDDRLQELLVDAAADHASIADADAFFLFPCEMAKLAKPLELFLGTLLQPSAHVASFYFRGVYFTGSLEARGKLAGKVTSAVDFTDGLFLAKVFPEPHLSRPVEKSVFSRNQLIRRLQMGMIAGFVALVVALVATAVEVRRQARVIEESFKDVKAVIELREGDRCSDTESIYSVLDSLQRIPSHLRYLAVPYSWIDDRVVYHAGKWLSHRAFEDIVLPAIDCRLRRERTRVVSFEPARPGGAKRTTEAVKDAYSELDHYLDEVLALEHGLEQFQDLAAPGGERDPEGQAQEAEELALYVFQSPPPKPKGASNSVFMHALARADFADPARLTKSERARIAERLDAMARSLHDLVLSRVALGDALIAEMNDYRRPIGESVGDYLDWLEWLTTSRLVGAPSAEGPCAAIRNRLDEAAKKLIQYDYPEPVRKMAALFSDDNCTEPARAHLASLSFPPYGTMFVKKGDVVEPNAKPALESAALASLDKLPFMQARPRRAFACQPAIAGWRDEQLAQAETFLTQYQNFAQAQNGGRDSLDDRLARRQLQAVLDEVLTDAQILPSPPRAGSTPDPEAAIADGSAAFAHQLDSLSKLDADLDRLGEVATRNRFDRCVRDYAGEMLRRISLLGDASRVYEPADAPASPDDDGSDPLYQLGTDAQVKDWLGRQRDRSGVLAAYSQPFVKYLDAGPARGDGGPPDAPGTAFWRGTLAELKRYRDAKDGGGTVGALETYFTKTLAKLDEDNCRQLLDESDDAIDGIDLFTDRHRALKERSELRCEDRAAADAYQRYRPLAIRFNRDLAGRYPFADRDAPDADAAVVRDFFRDYENERAALARAISGLKHGAWPRIRSFLKQLDAAADFFRPTLAAADGVRPVRLDVGFRALRRHERGGDQIIGWTLATGGARLDNPPGGKQLDWPVGESVELALSWATGSLLRPRADSTQTDLKIDDRTARFTGAGDWGLLRLIAAHRPRAVPARDPMDDSRCNLEFVVPTVDARTPRKQNSARLYLALGLRAIDPKSQSAQPLTVPRDWPRAAPFSP